LPTTYRAAQAQASLALQNVRAAEKAGDLDLAHVLMIRAQLLIAHAISIDERPRPTGWERYQGDGSRPK
jgi:hypothetical protein